MSSHFEVGCFLRCRDEVDMLQSYYDEVCSFPEEGVNIDWDTYERIYKAGCFFTVFLVDDASGDIMGFTGVFIQNHLHHKDTVVATVDSFLVTPEWRRKDRTAGRRLLAELEKECYIRGAKYMMMASTSKKDITEWQASQGYSPMDIYSMKKLT